MSNNTKVSLVIAERVYKKIVSVLKYKNVSISNVLLRQNVTNKAIEDIANTIDTFYIEVSKDFSDTTELLDVISTINTDKLAIDVLPVLENISTATQKAISDTANLQDVVSNELNKIFTEIVIASDTLNKNIDKGLVDVAGLNSYTTITTFSKLLEALPIDDHVLVYVVRSGSLLLNENLFNQSTFG